jgi:hypothetical protein
MKHRGFFLISILQFTLGSTALAQQAPFDTVIRGGLSFGWDGCSVDDYLIMATDYPHADAAEKFPERTAAF